MVAEWWEQMSATRIRPVERAYDLLPLGAIEPRGWLRQQLEIQANGLTGHLDECWSDIGDSQWLGGERGGWERGPYYVDGLLPLAHLLNDEALIKKSEMWVEAFLDSQDDDGWIGPAEQARDQGYEYDPWPRFVVLKVLRQYYEVSGEERILNAMLSFCEYLSTALDDNPLESWGHYRWADLVVSVLWLSERTDEPWLLNLARTAAEQGFEWGNHFDGLHGFRRPHTTKRDETDHAAHVVNNAMGIKAPGVRYLLTGKTDDRVGSAQAINALDRYHGQATGLYSGDEFFGGKHPSRGTELCGVVEYMYSLEVLASIHGNARFGDRLERLAFNGLPATFTPDMWTQQYDQQANQVICNVAEKDWFNDPEANVFGLAPNFGCCTANMHQGWPKFASHLWMRDGDELATIAFAPNAVTTDLDGQQITVSEETNYPFGESVVFTVETDEPATFALSIRLPWWVETTTVTTPDHGTETIEATADYHTVERRWTDGDAVKVAFETPTRVERRYHGAVTIHRGPLTFSFPIDAERKQIGGKIPHADWEFYPTEPWNYGLELNLDDPASSVSVAFNEPGNVPFSPESAPVTASVDGQLVADWGMDSDYAWADTVPSGVVRGGGDSESLTLIPYGCTNLRVTEFPWVQ
ncbi:beta-L-arabinofuranosidase domain-containing protein [Saliphagus infecundisoli]|uniref:Beta-L-arabinofuranosidase domain-containing protein n=1 Tax=Saliphagus infecundisoli TaxID=1849069 RepID=A0ABD5Q986_9EURY